jgi:hypothetical protein
MNGVTTKIIRPDIRVEGVFPTGFGLELGFPDTTSSFEQVWLDREYELRSLVRAWGFVVVKHPAAIRSSSNFDWYHPPEDRSDPDMPWHTDGRKGDNIVALTQDLGASPRIPGTAIAPARLINQALADERLYIGSELERIWDAGCPSAGAEPEMATILDIEWLLGETQLRAEIIALERKATASIRHQIHTHTWVGNAGAVLLIDNSFDQVMGCKTLHARFLPEGETYSGDQIYVTNF